MEKANMLTIPIQQAAEQGVKLFTAATNAACLDKYRGKLVIKELKNGVTRLLVENRDFQLI